MEDQVQVNCVHLYKQEMKEVCRVPGIKNVDEQAVDPPELLLGDTQKMQRML